MRAFEIITAVPWAMTEPALQHLLQVYETAIERKAAGMPLDRQAIAAEVGKPLDNTFVVTVRDGVAVIPVEGPIFRHANLMTDLSGATSLEMLALDFRQALANPAVHSILLDVDSPGGEANGVNEFSEMLYAARGQKPIVAYVSDTGASAAYWIASACDEIICDATAMLGSIGVVAAVPDPAARKARDIEFVSSQSPNKRPDVTTERGKAQIQVIVDSLAEIFIGAVARNRGVTPNTVQSDFGQGGVLVGQQAVAAGLADRLGSFEQVVAELQARHDEQARAERGAWSRMPSGTTEGSMKLFSPEWWTNMITGAQQAESLAPMSEAERNVPHAHVDKAPQAGTDTGAPAEAVPGAAELVAPIRGMTLMDGGPVSAAQAEPIRDPEKEAMRKQLAEERSRRFKAEAESFAATTISAGKAFPTERDTLMAQYIQAVSDDTHYGAILDGSTGQAGTRVDVLKRAYDARPAHGLTEERVKAHSSSAELHNAQRTDGLHDDDVEAADAATRARTWAQQQNRQVAKGGH